MSIEALGGLAEIHPTYVSSIERGLSNPTWDKLCNVADALDIRISALAKVAEAEVYGAGYTPDPLYGRPEGARYGKAR